MKRAILVFIGGVSLLDVAAAQAPQLGTAPQESVIFPQQWTPDGTATFVTPDDPALVAPTPAPPAPPAPPHVKPDPALVSEITKFMDDALTGLSVKKSPDDTQYYEKGDWIFKNEVLCCDLGPVSMAAILWKYRQTHPQTMDAAAKARQPWLHQVALESVERGISLHGPNGKLTNPGSHDVFWYMQFVNIYLILKDSLDATTQQRWLTTMRGEVAALEKSHDIPDPGAPGYNGTDGWYTNGNVDICHAEWVYLVWLATGDQQYKNLFELCWKHTLSPNVRWKGNGLFFLRPPIKADGSDGAGYITESNDPSRPGFDKAYGSLQMAALAELYLRSHDSRVLRVLNLLINAEMPHVDPKTLVLDATYGSRHSETVPFFTSSTPVLAWLGGRSDLLPLLPDVVPKALVFYFMRGVNLNSNDPGLYRGLGLEGATYLEAAMAAEQ
jgi:hypothetical protein